MVAVMAVAVCATPETVKLVLLYVEPCTSVPEPRPLVAVTSV